MSNNKSYNWIKKKGKLEGKGFLSKPKIKRKEILDKCVDKYGYRSCLGSILVLTKNRLINDKYSNILNEMKNWLKTNYGGKGSYLKSTKNKLYKKINRHKSTKNKSYKKINRHKSTKNKSYKKINRHKSTKNKRNYL